MRVFDPVDFSGSQPWGGAGPRRARRIDVGELHWTDEAYHWHVNDGVEVFVVASADMDMYEAKAARTPLIPADQTDDRRLQRPRVPSKSQTSSLIASTGSALRQPRPTPAARTAGTRCAPLPDRDLI